MFPPRCAMNNTAMYSFPAGLLLRFTHSLLLLLLLALLCGCGLKDTDKGAAAADAKSGEDPAWQGDPVPYKAVFKVEGGPKELAGKMEGLSQLEALKKEPPDSTLALERRARLDQEAAVKLMHSQCYYNGEAEISMDEQAKPVVVTITLKPGPRYHVGHALVHYDPKPNIPDAFLHRERVTGFWGLEKEKLPAPEFPVEVPGVQAGEPIEASAMLDAVDNIPKELVQRGYPMAKVVKSIYTLNKPKLQLNADIVIDPGPPAYMGNAAIKGNKEVNTSYLERLMPWDPGQEPWDNELMQDYANSLRSTGIFRTVEVKPGKPETVNGIAVLPVEVELAEGPQRTISASARYDSDTGFGVEGTWEHRNLFHNGEKIQVTAPISQEETGVKVHFEKPAFFGRRQRLLADAAALYEITEAYQQRFVRGSLGMERRLARQWTGAVSLGGETGYLKDNEHDEKPYMVVSPQGGFRYDGRNDKFNPSKGTMLEVQLRPFTGYYEEEFRAFAGKITAAAWYAPLGRKPDGAIDDTLVLAGRYQAGAMPASTSLRSIPSSLRYFAGGAGTVRGYPYQAIGPRDSEDDPLGGRSFQVLNLEARYMVAENIGIVPFLDGGMVFKDEYPDVLGDMNWGLGLGFRYYTPIGPVRLDVAAPLHYIEGDPPVQFYISIGQSF